MRWVLRLVETGADAPSRNADLMEICRPEGLGEIADLGLTLAEAKQLLTSIQRAVVASQANHHGRLRPDCRSCRARCHVKDWRPRRVATVRRRDGATSPISVRCLRSHRDGPRLALALPVDT